MSEAASKWLGERLADWEKRGHDTTTLQQHLAAESVGASERLLHAERTIEAAERLRGRLEDMPAAWPERDVLLSRLQGLLEKHYDLGSVLWRQKGSAEKISTHTLEELANGSDFVLNALAD